MSWQRPDSLTLFRAIDLYLGIAYPSGVLPAAVRSRLESLKSGPGDVFDNATWERDAQQPPARFGLRLGNSGYPHMKLVIERSPDGEGYLMRADTHDKHISLPPGSREHEAFAQLIRKNQEIAAAIEATWADAGLPTFKEFLRQDLARRAQAAQAPA